MPKKKSNPRAKQRQTATQPRGPDLSGGERGGDKEKPDTIWLNEPPIVESGAS